MLVLSDSLLSAHKGWGVHLRMMRDGPDRFLTCQCVASGCSLMQVWDGRLKCPVSAISMASNVLEGKSKKHELRTILADDPLVRVVLVKAAMSISDCRDGEQFPNLVAARKESRLMSRLETPWTICDLEDVVQGRPHIKQIPEIEACKLRNKKGLYSDEDPNHFHAEVAKKAEDELLRAVRRTGLARYGDALKNEILLVIATGWNNDGESYYSLDANGKAWLRAELVATAELCALNGHPLSVFRAKIAALANRRKGSHSYFMRRSIRSIKVVKPPKRNPLTRQTLPSKRKFSGNVVA